MASISPKKSSSIQRFLTSAKNTLANFARQRPLLALLLSLLLLLVLCSLGIFASTPQQEFVLIKSKSLFFDIDTLQDVVTYLRANDARLVRPSPSETTWKRQISDACTLYLDQAYTVLNGRYSQDLVKNAVELITLCTTDRPRNRAKLTTPTSNAIVKLLKPSNQFSTRAAAAECIWISSFASKQNHDDFVKAGAVERLSNLILVNQDCTKQDDDSSSQCHLAKMWAGAALQNLAAAYCDDDDNAKRCNWKWTTFGDGKTERQEIQITNDHVVFNPESLRLSMITNTQLMETLTQIICDNVKELDKSPSERTWPSRAEIDQAKYSPSVVAWGAIGAIRNLALSPQFYESMPQNLLKCLCSHAVRSPDWLESSKAKDAIYRLGFSVKDVCEPLYDASTCTDYKDWEDEDEKPCRTYEKKRWCAEYRNYAPEGDTKYVTAGEACCACGGGNKKR